MSIQPTEPRPADKKNDAFSKISELGRKSLLAAHVNRTISRAQAKMRAGDPEGALKILTEAGEKYEKLGGEPPSTDPRFAVYTSPYDNEED